MNPSSLDRRSLLRTLGVIGAATAVGALAACAPSGAPVTTPNATTPGTRPEVNTTTSPAAGKRVLLVYFSRPGENYFNGGRINLTVGNTEVLSQLIASLVAVDTYRIEASDPYSNDYLATVARNVTEEATNARPGIATPLPSLVGYDTVLLGSPIWNVQEPMIMRTFMEGVDLRGLKVHPFVTHAMSGLGNVPANYARHLPRSTVGEGLAVRGEEVATSRPAVEAWLRRIGLLD